MDHDAYNAARACFEAYLAHHGANRLAELLELFEVDATVEDPVGAPVHVGAAAVEAFYRQTQETNGPLAFERVGPGLFGGTEWVAHVKARLTRSGSPPAMDVIYVLRMSPTGRIAGLRAWY